MLSSANKGHTCDCQAGTDGWACRTVVNPHATPLATHLAANSRTKILQILCIALDCAIASRPPQKLEITSSNPARV
jgi:hypothetical protein